MIEIIIVLTRNHSDSNAIVRVPFMLEQDFACCNECDKS